MIIDEDDADQADEIIRRLKAPPRPKFTKIQANWTIDPIIDLSVSKSNKEKEILEILSNILSEEIDKQIMINYGQGNYTAR
jgi:hypothetical protein